MLETLRYIPYLVPCLSCFLWAAILLLRWGKTSLLVKTGTAALLLMGVSSAIRFVMLTEGYDQTNGWPIVEVVCLLSFFSCMLLYIRRLTPGKPSSRRNDLLLFLPALFVGGLLAGLYLWMNEEQRLTFLPEALHPHAKNEAKYPDLLYRAYYIMYVYIYKMTVVALANVALIYAWSKHNRQNRPILFFLVFALFFSLFILEWDYLLWWNHRLWIGICLSLWGIALFYLGYYLSRQKRQIEPITPEQYTVPESDNWHRIREKLLPVFLQLMEEEHLFRQPNLRVDDLTRLTQTNRNYIFRLFKEEYGCGFTEYINRRRIDYAQRLARLQPGLTQEQLAQQSGFTHSATFSRTFKQYTGMTFREWQKTAQ